MARDLPLIFGKLRVLRFPSLRAPLDILFLVCCIVLTADVLWLALVFVIASAFLASGTYNPFIYFRF